MPGVGAACLDSTQLLLASWSAWAPLAKMNQQVRPAWSLRQCGTPAIFDPAAFPSQVACALAQHLLRMAITDAVPSICCDEGRGGSGFTAHSDTLSSAADSQPAVSGQSGAQGTSVHRSTLLRRSGQGDLTAPSPSNGHRQATDGYWAGQGHGRQWCEHCPRHGTCCAGMFSSSRASASSWPCHHLLTPVHASPLPQEVPPAWRWC